MKPHKMRGRQATPRGGELEDWEGRNPLGRGFTLYLVLKVTLEGRFKLAGGAHVPSGSSIGREEMWVTAQFMGRGEIANG